MLKQETNLDQIMHRQCHRLTIFLYLIWQIVTQSGTIVRRAGLSNYALHCFCDVKVHFTEISWHRNVNIFFCIFYLPKTSLQSKAFNNQEVNISSWYRPSARHALILLVKTKSTKKRLKIWGTWKTTSWRFMIPGKGLLLVYFPNLNVWMFIL